MADKALAYLELADHATHQITSSYQEWTGFLAMMGRIYKYPYREQLMIYAQRPDATACASYELWSKQMRRYVMQGARGIALIDTSTGENKVRYVFDVSDTREKENARRPWLWQYRPEHQAAVSSALTERYGVSGEDGLADQLEKIAGQLAADYWNDHEYDLLHIVDGSFLEEYDAFNIGKQFRDAAAVSITFALMARCGLEPENYFEHEDFLSIFDFNTPDTITELGTAVSQGSEAVLRQIEVIIKRYEREKLAERNAEHGKQLDLHPGGGRSAAEPDPARTAETESDQIRTAAPELSETAPPGPVQPPVVERDTVQPPAGGGGSGQRDAGADDALPGANGGGHRGTEIQGPHDLGGTNEQLQVPGGGDHLLGTDLQLNTQPAPEGPSVKAPGPSVISEAEPFPVPAMNDYNATKAAHPDDIVLFQMGDFFEMYGNDAETAAPLLGLALTTRPVPGAGRVKMCGIPAHALEQYVEKLRDKYDVTISAVDAATNERGVYTLRSIDHEAETPAPTIREQYDKYKPIVIAAVTEDTAYRNACGHSDRENAVIEGNAAVRRAVLHSGDMELIRFFSDVPEFRNRLHREVIDETYPKLHELLRPLSQDDIDEALQAWNGDLDSKRRVVRYMEAHGREKGTAEWLSREYGGAAGKNLFVIRQGSPEMLELPWPKVQRRIAQLIKEDRFFTQQELDNFEDIDPAAIREQLESGKPSAFVEQVMADVEQIAAQEQAENTPAEPPDLSGQPATREVNAPQEVISAADQPTHDPLAPAYNVGDTVYLDKTAFEITDINLFDVQLRDPTLAYPILRSEPKDRFEQLLWQDSRNGPVTEFLPADLGKVNADLREILTSGLLTDRDKAYISGWLRSGENNTQIGHRLSEQFADRAETMTLMTGEMADYFTSTTGIEVKIHDKFSSGAYMGWALVPSVLRALWLQELDGFSRAAVQREPVELEGKLSYQVGDKVAFAYGDHDVIGTIEGIGVLDVLIHTGPYAWSHQTVSKDFFEDAVRHDERNAHLFTQEPEPERPAPGPATIYPGDKNGLPFDIVVEHLPVDGPEQAQAVPGPANFRITDDHLGEGGLKEKFRRNLEAVTTLHEIEFDKRAATPAEQEILSRYVGWGALADAFDPKKPDWANEYKELQVVLTPEEYNSARASTLNAHYTSPAVIKAIYEAVGNMGFTGGNILEPACGVGNFFGLLPESMAASKLYGTELDSLTGRIAQQLYPKANITVAGFETTDRRDFYDLAVGNVPFGQYKVNDPAYNRLGFNIHNYFFAKALDQVRPGGIVAFVTSRYTMDAKGEDVRKYLAERADLLGAIRLPNNAFKANAGTEVVSDILFLQKRDSPQTELPDWVHTGENEDGFTINRYFMDHPEMILGRQSAESTQYGKQDFTVEPIEGLVLADQLHDAVKYIRGQYREADPPELEETAQEGVTIPADPDVKNFSYTIVDGDVYFRENSIMAKQELNATAAERVKGMVELRDCVHRLIDLQMDEYTPDSAIREQQRELNRLYDSFTAKFGLINDRGNRLAFSSDSAYYLLCALEVVDEDGRLERKADMFTKRTISPHRAVDHVDTPSEALAVSIAEKARVDMPYMAQLTGRTEAELERALAGVIFRDVRCNENPDYIPKAYADLNRFPLVTADEYLSGNVRRKLRMAQAMAQVLPPEEAARIQPNVEALTAAQPRDLDASEIEVRLGATWIDKKYIQQFMEETLDTPRNLRRDIQVNYSPHTAEWNITAKFSVSTRDIPAYTTYGTSRANAYEILEDSLNLRDVRVYDKVEGPDGKEKRVLNGKETTLAQQKQQLLRNAFRDWIWKDPQRRQALVRQYNEEMNSTRPREYDGSHITFSGMNPEIKLLPHQVNAVARVLYGGNSLLAHEVGAGKTFEMIAAAMESKRLGLCRKSIFVVPNHLTEQWASEFMRLYPSANVLVTRKQDFEPARRKKFCARIATGDYDAVIIGQSQFEKIPVSYERQEQLIQNEIREVMAGIQEVKDNNGEHFTVKQMERTRRQLEDRLEKLRASHRKDTVVSFEQLGVDRMFVDESDFYKNLFMVTKMRNVAGLSTTDAQKSSDMFAKCRYLDEITGNRGVIFATGTPISNSMTEMFTIHRYLQYDRLQEMGMGHFDCWASRFGETATVLELAPEGTGYRPRTRFSKFFNLPELMNLFKEAADVKTADQLNLPRPEVEYHTVASKPTEHQKAMVQELSKRASRVHSGSVDPHIDNMLKITSDGRKLGLDQRIIDPLLPDEPGTKVNRCVENILSIWREGAADRLTQLVFCDISTPQAPVKRQKAGELTEDAADPVRPFTVYDDIRSKLIAAGMPSEEIAFIHDAKTDKQKKDLFAKVNAGQVRVLIGSTSKMGAGTNVQKKLIAMHDLDCPWRPRDLIQRKGRIERRGNDNKKVHVFRYVTEGTFDAYLWQTVENKQKFISQIMTSKSPVRSCEDVDEAALSYAEIKALCAGDPRIKERMDLDIVVSRLKLLKADHQSQQFRLEDRVLKHIPAEIKQNQEFIAGFKADMETLAAHPHPIVKVAASPPKADGEQPAAAGPDESQPPAAVELKQGFAGMEISGVTFIDKVEAGKALIAACKELEAGETKEIGSYRGFSMTVSRSKIFENTQMSLKGEMTHLVDLGEDILGNLVRMDNALEKMPERLMAVEGSIQTLQQQLIAAKAELGKPFPQEAELQEKSARLIELDAALNIDRGAPPPEQAVAKSARPSVLDSLKRPLPPREKSDKPKRSQLER